MQEAYQREEIQPPEKTRTDAIKAEARTDASNKKNDINSDPRTRSGKENAHRTDLQANLNSVEYRETDRKVQTRQEGLGMHAVQYVDTHHNPPQLKLRPEAEMLIRPVFDVIIAAHENVIPFTPTSHALLTNIDIDQLHAYNTVGLGNIIRQTIEIPPAGTAPYVKLSPSEDFSTRFEQDFLSLRRTNEFSAKVIGDALIKAVEANPGAYGVTTADELAKIKVKFEVHPDEERLRYNNEMPGYSDVETLRKLRESSNAPQNELARELYEVLEKEDVEKFRRLYVKRLLKVANIDITGFEGWSDTQIKDKFDTLSQREKFKYSRKVSEDIEDAVLYTNVRIFGSVFGQPPDTPFQEIANRHSGHGMYVTPLSQWTQMLIHFEEMHSKASSANQSIYDIPFVIIGQEDRRVYDHETKQTIPYSVPGLDYGVRSMAEFFKAMEAKTDAVKNLIEAGVNVRYLQTREVNPQQGTLIQAHRSYLENTLTSRVLDELSRSKYASMIHSAEEQVKLGFTRGLSRLRWVKQPQMTEMLFNNTTKIQDEARRNIHENYTKGGQESWVGDFAGLMGELRARAVHMVPFAAASYAEAPIDKDGNATYIDPALKGLTLFNAWEAALQWQTGDTFFKYVSFCPDGPMPDAAEGKWQHETVYKEGKDVLHDIQHVGLLAFEGRKFSSYDIRQNMYEGNWMQLGGWEVMGTGWRLKNAYVAWLHDEVIDAGNNPKLRLEDKNKKPRVEVFTNGWKRTQNIGTAYLRNYMHSYILGNSDFFGVKEGGKPAKEKEFEHFFRFLYKRYFEGELGQGFEARVVEDHGKFSPASGEDGRTVTYAEMGEEGFWSYVKSILSSEDRVALQETHEYNHDPDKKKGIVNREKKRRKAQVQAIIEDALAANYFERSPIDFFLIEKPTRSQNGVLLYDEIIAQFINKDEFDAHINPHGNEVKQEEFEIIVNVLSHIQNVAREDASKEIKRLLDENADDIDLMDPALQDAERTKRRERKEQRNMYGDLSSDKSDISYEVNEEFINHIFDTNPIYKATDVITYQVDNIKYQMTKDELREKVKKLYSEIRKRILQRPEVNKKEEAEPNDTPEQLERKEAYRKRRNFHMKKRLQYQGQELVSGNTGFAVNADSAYEFLQLTRTGVKTLGRNYGAIHDLQDTYNATTNAEGKIMNALKDAARKGDTSGFVGAISEEVKTPMKREDEDKALIGTDKWIDRGMYMLRRNWDAESTAGALNYVMSHKKMSLAGAFVEAGAEFALDHEGRSRLIQEFELKAIIPKRVKPENRKIRAVNSYEEHYRITSGEFGAMVGRLRDSLGDYGNTQYLRDKAGELSGEGKRNRHEATGLDIAKAKKTELLIILAIMIALAAKEGMKEMDLK